MRICLVLLVTLLLLPIENTAAQESYPSNFSVALTTEPSVRDALSYVDDNFDAQVAE